jgi:acetyl-CoA synthetase
LHCKASCSILITANEAIRGGKTINLKKTADDAVVNCPTIKHVFVMNRTSREYKKGKLDIDLDKVT